MRIIIDRPDETYSPTTPEDYTPVVSREGTAIAVTAHHLLTDTLWRTLRHELETQVPYSEGNLSDIAALLSAGDKLFNIDQRNPTAQ